MFPGRVAPVTRLFAVGGKYGRLVLVQLQAWVSVIVKRAAGHTISVDLQPVVFGSVFHGDRRLDGFVDTHVHLLLDFS